MLELLFSSLGGGGTPALLITEQIATTVCMVIGTGAYKLFMLLTLNKMSSLLHVSHLHQHSQEVFAWVCFICKVEPVVHISMYKLFS